MAAAAMDVGAWATHAAQAVRRGLYARLSGEAGPRSVASSLRHAANGGGILPAIDAAPDVAGTLQYLAVLLAECDDLLEFQQAESAVENTHVPDASLEHAQFNYALALEAIASLQTELGALRGSDPDETRVGETPLPADGDKIEAIRADHAKTLQALSDRYAAALEAQAATHAHEMRSRADEYAELLAHVERMQADMNALKNAHADELRRLNDEHTSALESAWFEHTETLSSEKERNAALVAERDVLAADKAGLVAERDALAADKETLAKAKTALTTELDSRLAALTAEKDHLAVSLASAQTDRVAAEGALREEHSAALDELRSAHASELEEAQRRSRETQAALDAVRAQLDVLQAEHASELDAAQAHIQHLQATATERQQELDEAAKRLLHLGRELAEMQRDAERASDMAAQIEALQQRVTATEADLVHQREQLRSVESMRTSWAHVASERDEQRMLVEMLKSSAAAADEEHGRTRQALSEAHARILQLEQSRSTTHSSDDAIVGLRDAKRRLHERNVQVERLQRRVAELEANSAPRRDLSERVAQLELELNAKATEIEAADTRLLSIIKENKRLITQTKKLRMNTTRPLGDATNRSPMRS